MSFLIRETLHQPRSAMFPVRILRSATRFVGSKTKNIAPATSIGPRVTTTAPIAIRCAAAAPSINTAAITTAPNVISFASPRSRLPGSRFRSSQSQARAAVRCMRLVRRTVQRVLNKTNRRCTRDHLIGRCYASCSAIVALSGGAFSPTRTPELARKWLNV